MFTLYKGAEGSPYPGYGSMNGAAVDPKTNIAYAFWSKNNGAKAIIRFGPDNTGQSYTLNGVTKADGAVMRWIAYTPYGYSTAAAIDANGDMLFTAKNSANEEELFRLKNVSGKSHRRRFE